MVGMCGVHKHREPTCPECSAWYYSPVEIKRLEDRAAKMEAALAWYGEQARLCRLIHSGGDAGRHAIVADGGQRARDALTKSD